MSAPVMCAFQDNEGRCPREADVELLIQHRDTKGLGRVSMCEGHAGAWVDADSQLVTLTRIAKVTT